MAQHLGMHADRLAGVRALRSPKGRRAQGRFTFEGATLLEEARASGFPIDEIYCTEAEYEKAAAIRELDAHGTAVFVVGERSAAAISDLETPSGVVAVAPMRLRPLPEILSDGSLALVLADVNDPANAGTLLRSAEAFGCSAVVFGALGIDPYHPKVVRGSMGGIFRLALALADPSQLAEAAGAPGVRLVGLSPDGACLDGKQLERPVAIVVGNERHGLGRWADLCEVRVAIAMQGRSESLSAAVAGSIALYEASRASRYQVSALRACQESGADPKSQDYRG